MDFIKGSLLTVCYLLIAEFNNFGRVYCWCILESLVWIHASIPNRLFVFHGLLSQYEALENGLQDIHSWMGEAETLLNSINYVNTEQGIQETLDSHKVKTRKCPGAV